MASPHRRKRLGLRVEVLEDRALLNGAPSSGLDELLVAFRPRATARREALILRVAGGRVVGTEPGGMLVAPTRGDAATLLGRLYAFPAVAGAQIALPPATVAPASPFASVLKASRPHATTGRKEFLSKPVKALVKTAHPAMISAPASHSAHAHTLAAHQYLAAPKAAAPAAQAAPGVILLNDVGVTFQATATAAQQRALIGSLGATVLHSYTDPGGTTTAALAPPPGTSVATLLAQLQASPLILAASQDFDYPPMEPLVPPAAPASPAPAAPKAAAPVTTPPAPATDAAPDNSLIVAFKPGTSAAAQQADLAAVGGIVLETFFSGGEAVLVGAGTTPAAAQAALQADADVSYVDLNGATQAASVKSL